MTNHNYPRIGQVVEIDYSGMPENLKQLNSCFLCGGAKADQRLEIQFDNYKPNNEYVTVHSACSQPLRASFLLTEAVKSLNF